MTESVKIDFEGLVGDPYAPPGSYMKCKWLRHRANTILEQEDMNQFELKEIIDDIVKHQAWKILKDRNGKEFNSYTSFCRARPPYGLGRSDSDLEQIIKEGIVKRIDETVKKAQEVTEPLKEVGRPVKEERDIEDREIMVTESENVTIIDLPQISETKQKGNSSEYRIKKLRRDHPEIVEKLEQGEYKSVAAAERAARGEEPEIKRAKKTTVEKLLALWDKATEEDRKEFLKTIKRKA